MCVYDGDKCHSAGREGKRRGSCVQRGRSGRTRGESILEEGFEAVTANPADGIGGLWNDISSGVVARIPPMLNPCRLYCCASAGPGGYYNSIINIIIIVIIIVRACLGEYCYTRPVFCFYRHRCQFVWFSLDVPHPLHHPLERMPTPLFKVCSTRHALHVVIIRYNDTVILL